MASPIPLSTFADGDTYAGVARARSHIAKLGEFTTAFDFIPAALHASISARTNTVDLSTFIQDGIDYLYGLGGGVLYFARGTYKANVVLKSGVVLVSLADGQFGYGPSSIDGVTLKAAAAGYVVDTPAGGATSCGVRGINFTGLGAGTACGGIRFRSAGWSAIVGCGFNSFANEAILLDSGSGACVIEDILAVNCVLNRTRAAVIGCVDVSGVDHFLSRVEATISGSAEGTVQSASLYCVGVALRATNCFVSSVIGEISDIGFHVSGALNRFALCRADLNYGHGWYITGGSNQFSSCIGLNNSQDTTNTYDNWLLTSASGNNSLAGCSSSSTTAKRVRYGFNDQLSSDTNKNNIAFPLADGASTQDLKNIDFAGSSIQVPTGPFRTLTVNSTTPSAANYGSWKTANTLATTITNFTGGVSGQNLELYCGDGNTTIQHNGATISTTTAANVLLVNGVIYRFKRDGALWRLS